MPENKLIVWTRLPYEARYIPPRKRNSEWTILRDDVPLKIAVVDPEDCPVAVRLWREAHGQRAETEMRAMEGFLWRPLRLDNGGVVSAREIADLARGQGSWRDNPFILPKHKGGAHWQERGQIDARVWETDTRAESVAHAQKTAASVVLCGDAAYRKTVEPIWRVDLNRDHPTVGWILGAAETPGTAVNCFRLDRLEDALSFARAAAGDKSLQPMDCGAEVMMPEILKRNDLTRSAQGFIPGVLSSASHFLHTLSREAIMAFCDLRDAVRELEAAPEAASEDAARQAAEAMCRFSEMLAGEDANEVAQRLARDMRPASLRFEMSESRRLSEEDVAMLEQFQEERPTP